MVKASSTTSPKTRRKSQPSTKNVDAKEKNAVKITPPDERIGRIMETLVEHHDRSDYLRSLINIKMRENGHTAPDLAAAIGISKYYLATVIASGTTSTKPRLFSRLDKKIQRALAQYLGISVIQLQIFEGELDISDFTVHDYDIIEYGYRSLAEDPELGIYAPNEHDWKNTPIAAKISILRFYERLKDEQFLDVLRVPT